MLHGFVDQSVLHTRGNSRLSLESRRVFQGFYNDILYLLVGGGGWNFLQNVSVVPPT